jgi:hypothetical protein
MDLNVIKLVRIDLSELIKGTSYKAFQTQANKCDISKGSCIRNQILDILKREITKKNKGESTDYLVSEIGSFLGTSSEMPSTQNEAQSRSIINFHFLLICSVRRKCESSSFSSVSRSVHNQYTADY